MSTIDSNLQRQNLFEYLKTNDPRIHGIVTSFNTKKEFISFFKGMLKNPSKPIEISNEAYESLQMSLQQGRADPTLLVGRGHSTVKSNVPNTKFLLSTLKKLKKIDFPAEVIANRQELRNSFGEMLQKTKHFGFVYFCKDHVMDVTVESDKDSVYVLISDSSACLKNITNVIRDIKRVVKDPSNFLFYGVSKVRQTDDLTCSIFSLKDLCILSKISLVNFIKEQTSLEQKKGEFFSYKQQGFFPISYYLLDSLFEKYPVFLKSSQVETNSNFVAKVPVNKGILSKGCYGQHTYKIEMEPTNFYTRYFNLKYLALGVDALIS